MSDVNSDGDAAPDCNDGCPSDPAKVTAGLCGCGVSDLDSDGDSTPNCTDGCPNDAAKIAAGVCGCGTSDADSDADGRLDCQDACALDPAKTAPGVCGCGTPDGDSDGDGHADCVDLCPGFADGADEDSDGIPDGCDVRTSCRSDLIGGIGVHMGDLVIDEYTNLAAYQNVTCVTGGLMVWGDVTNLHGLESLTSVAGSVHVWDSQLTNLDGLESLGNVDGSVNISFNPALVDVDGLAALSRIGARLDIIDNTVLESVRGLSALTSLGQSAAPDPLEIARNARLPGCQVLEIEQRTHTRCGAGYFYCSGNNGIGSCGELPADFACVPGASGPGVYDGEVFLSNGYPAPSLGGVTCITGSLTIDRESLSAFTHLQKVGGSLWIRNTDATTLAELGQLTEIGGRLDLSGNLSLTDISGLDRLTRLGTGANDLVVLGNQNLAACHVWALAARLGKSCQYGPYNLCAGNTGAGSCGDLPADFACVPGAQGPGVYDGSIWTSYSTNLREYGGVRCVTGSLWLSGSPDLTYFAGLREVGDSLSIGGTTLTDLTSLSALREVGGALWLNGNDQLQSVTGLEQLRRVGGELQIQGNSLLRDLSALDGLTAVTGARVSYNAALPACYAWNLGARGGTPCAGPYGNSCPGNTGTGSCGSLPPGFQCVPGAIGPGVFDGDIGSGSPSEYGGLTCVTGSLYLSGELAGDRRWLHDLQQIGGNFQVWDQPVDSLSGLESLTRIGGHMVVSSNMQLASLAGLDNLASVGGSLEVSYNAQLSNLSGLGRLTSVGAAGTWGNPALSIRYNEHLPYCEVLGVASRTQHSCLQNICYGNTGTGSCEPLPLDFVCAPGAVGPGVYDGSVSLWDPQQADYLRGVSCITGDLAISSPISDLSALSSLQMVGGDLRIEYTWGLPQVDALSRLTSVGGYLSLTANSALTSLSGLRNLKDLGGGANVSGNEQLPACWVWDLRSRFEGRVSDWGNNGSGHCGALPADFRCEPGARGPGVWDHDATRWDLPYIGSATCITGNLTVYDSALTDLVALEYLEMIGGNVELINNQQLTSVDGLENLTSIGGNLRISYNPALGDLHGLASLAQLGAESSGPALLELLGNESLPACWGPTLEQQTGVVCGDASTPPGTCQGNSGSGSCTP